MTRENKILLFTDLCARLPYNLVINANGTDIVLDDAHKLLGTMNVKDSSEEFKRRNSNLSDSDFTIILCGCYYGEDIKPYLRPLSSMKKEEVDEYKKISKYSCAGNISYEYSEISITIPSIEKLDWLNAHYFDYRGLIEMGLALKAPEDMYKFS